LTPQDPTRQSQEVPETPSDLQQRLAYLGFDQSDSDLLAALRPVLERNAPALVAAFYRHLLSFHATRELLRDPAAKTRLLAKQREYLLSLGGPQLDEGFLAERRRIGEVHERIGLEPRWYLGAYALYFSLLAPVIGDAFEDQPQRAMQTLISLQKLLLLDAQLAMETYIDRQHHELEYLTEELATEGRRLAHDYEEQRVELRQTVDRARAAEELASVATLVAGLAHEIGTPMGVIQGHAKLLEPAVEGEDALWRLRTIQEQIGRISRIIHTLLNMARPGKMRRQPVALAPLIESSLSFVREKLGCRGIEVKKSLHPVPSVVGDGERLQQLFLNLFLNAADAMPEGGELGVSLDSTDAEVEIRVSDTGVGIEPELLGRIFEPFFTTKPAGEGSGLGLMVVKGIVGDHGGRIDVSTRRGEGTEFVVRLPVAAVEAEGGAAS
jgi:signal transduction histidine kinase